MKFKFKNFQLYLLIFGSLSCLIFYYLAQSIKRNENFYIYSQFEVKSSIDFNIDRDVLVFVHIQKTGGSDFDRNIVKNLLVRTNKKWKRACNFNMNKTLKRNNSVLNTKLNFLNKKVKFKKFSCPRTKALENQDINWYFSRQTFGWACGLHPDYTMLKTCTKKFYQGIDDKNLKYFTILRDPIKRYVSEWQHVARGATWKSKKNKVCLNNYLKCFINKSTWENVSLDEFMSCKYNLANNRQTRLLALYDSNFKMCSNPSLSDTNSDKENNSYDEELLKRAKLSLHSMSFFALNEFQNLSGQLFEKCFSQLFKFSFPLSQSNSTTAEIILKNINRQTLNKIKNLNYLDLKLYEYAQNLFFKKLKFYNISLKKNS